MQIAQRLREHPLTEEKNTFVQALILSCLAHATPPILETFKKDLAARLRTQLEPHGSANYWLRGSTQSQQRPYPDDWDTTSCTLSALTLTDSGLLDGEILGKATMLLTAVEIEAGGPYRTWLVPADAPAVWRDVDLAVNANIAYFLSLQGVRLEKLDTWLIAQVASGNISSPYYPSPLQLLYFLSRAFKGTPHIHLVAAQARRYQANSVLESALLAIIFLQSGSPYEALPYKQTILEAIADDAYFASDPFCIDTVTQGVVQYLGSASLTAALCFEALALAEQNETAPQTNAHEKQRELLHQKVLAHVRARFHALAPDLSQAASRVLDKLMETRAYKEITVLPFDVAVAWQGTPLKLREEQLLQLCMAHISGWLAYTIYDDFFDGVGDIHLLSVANTCLRDVLCLFALNLPGEHFQLTVREILDTMDGANAWEINHARLPLPNNELPHYPDLTVLAQRSLGILLTPLAVLRHFDVAPEAPETEHLRQFFIHFLTAKQLNDDLHDWEEDVRRGHVTAVVAKIFIQTGTPYTYERLPEYRQIFWHQSVLTFVENLHQHLQAAEHHATQLPLVHPDALLALLAPLRTSASKVAREREQSLDFLKALENPPPPTAA